MTNEELLDPWAQADYEQGLVEFVKDNGWWAQSEVGSNEDGHLVIKYIWDDGRTFEVTY